MALVCFVMMPRVELPNDKGALDGGGGLLQKYLGLGRGHLNIGSLAGDTMAMSSAAKDSNNGGPTTVGAAIIYFDRRYE